MDNKTLNEIYGKVQKRQPSIQQNEDYVEGKNPYILKKQPGKKPDNRIPVALAKITVESMAGYAGRAGDRKTIVTRLVADETEKDDPFIEYTRAMDSYNDEEIETSELYDEGLTQGESYEIWWTSDEVALPNGLLTAEYKIVPTESIYIKWSDSIKPSMEYFVYFNRGEDTMYATVGYAGETQEWSRKDGGEWVIDDTYPNPFSTPPLNIFPTNRKSIPIFEAEKPLIDAFDEMVSKSLNEVDRYNAAITLWGKKVSEEFLKALENGQISAVDDLGDEERADLPRFLEKNFSGVTPFYNQLMDRVKELYMQSVNVVDMSDENFAGQSTGIAMAYKLLGMEFKASQIDTYFNKGMKRRIELYADVYNMSARQIDLDDYKVHVDTKRNIPVDVESSVKVASALANLVSEETLLRYLPNTIIDDVEKEIARKAAEMPQDILGLNGGTDDAPTDAGSQQAQERINSRRMD